MVIALALLCICVVAATAYRSYRSYSQPAHEFDWSSRGLSDFHNGTYYPSLAFRNGINPYSREMSQKYPVSAPSRPCPPITYILHQPFTWFELHTADALFFIYNTCLLLLLAYVGVWVSNGKVQIGYWLLVSLVLLISRPGHITLFTGYYTPELVLGTLVALHFAKSKPTISAIGMLVASAKPTFILPLILLMFARKNYRALALGIVLCTVAGVGGLAWLARDSSIAEVIQGISEGQVEFHADETEFPVNTWTRVDVLGMFAKIINWVPEDKVYLASMFGFVLIPCVVIRQIVDREVDSGMLGISSLIALLTSLLGIYHHSYDCLLVVVPWVAITFFSSKVMVEIQPKTKWFLGVLLSIPLVNYLSTQSARNGLGLEQTSFTWQAITLINGACLSLALIIVLAVGWRLAVSHAIQKDFGR